MRRALTRQPRLSSSGLRVQLLSASASITIVAPMLIFRLSPNSSFLNQLEVFYQASCKVSQHDKGVRKFYLDRLVKDISSIHLYFVLGSAADIFTYKETAPSTVTCYRHYQVSLLLLRRMSYDEGSDVRCAGRLSAFICYSLSHTQPLGRNSLQVTTCLIMVK